MQGAFQIVSSYTTASSELLGALPKGELKKLMPDLETVNLAFGQVLHQPHQRIEHVYFPVNAMVSLLTSVDADRAAESALVGPEGMVGVAVALGMAASPFLAIVSVGGQGMRMKASALRQHVARRPVLQRELLRYTGLLMAQVAQTAACNRFHLVTERMARWLLTTRDRVHSGEFRITQEFLARMLGVRRVGVTEAAMSLQQRKLIAYNRGNMVILDHRGLTAAACSCYKVVKDIYLQS